MTDKVTASKAPAKKAAASDDTDNSDKIADLLDQVRDLMVEDGADPATAEALTNFARSGSPQIVGNLADLQRMGAIAVTGEMPVNAMPAGDQAAQETSSIEDAFAEPPGPAEREAAKDMAQISADAFTADEKAAKEAK